MGGFSFDCSRFRASLRAIAKILPNSFVFSFIAITIAFSKVCPPLCCWELNLAFPVLVKVRLAKLQWLFGFEHELVNPALLLQVSSLYREAQDSDLSLELLC
jgi:hypothetical protein